MRSIALTVLFLFFGLPAAAYGPVEALVERLTATTATVLSEREREVLLDVGSKAGVVPYDLFAVAGEAKQVLHPQTGAVLGELSETKAVLQVLWVKENFSGAKRVRGSEMMKGGEKATRFSELNAGFVACETDAEDLLAELRQRLPQLRWQGYQHLDGDCTGYRHADEQTDMVVIATAENLSVRDAAGNLLLRVSRPVPKMSVQQISTEPATKKFERWYGGDWKGEPAALVAGDFDGNQRLEVAVAAPGRIVLGRLEQQTWKEIAHFNLPVTHRVLALEAFDVDGDGRAEICVSAANGSELSSFLLVLRDGKLSVIQREIPLVVRAVRLSGQVALYGQGIENGRWGGPIQQLIWKDGTLVAADTVQIPADSGLRGLALVTTETDGHSVFVRLGWNDILQVMSSSGEKLWGSVSSYGGSENYLEVAGDVAQGTEHNTRNLYVQQRLQAVGSDQVLVPINYGSRFFKRQISYEESQVQMVQWDGRALRVLWETPKEKGYLADYFWADVDNDGQPELAMLIAYAKEGLFSSGRYSLVVVEP